MNKTSIDWRYLGQDMLWPGLSALVMSLVLAATLWFHSAQEKAYAQYSVNQDAMHDSYDALVARRRILERYHKRYDEYRLTGFVGQESRLEWVDTIHSSVAQLDVPHVAYAIEPQLEVIAPVMSSHAADADIKIYVSRIALEIGMVHELDFVRFFERLRSEVPGLMKVDKCKMDRIVDISEKTTIDANISANCSLMLFSVITSDIDASGAGS